jgi:hypothetical protein
VLASQLLNVFELSEDGTLVAFAMGDSRPIALAMRCTALVLAAECATVSWAANGSPGGWRELGGTVHRSDPYGGLQRQVHDGRR